MMNRIYLAVVFFILLMNNAYSQENWNDILAEGDDAFSKSNYALAISKYEQALAGIHEEETSVTVLYNLGNAYYKNENLGMAILYWEKAKLLAPNDKDINFNLRIAKDSIKGEVIPVKPFFLLKGWQKMQSLFPSKVWAWLSITLLWLGILGILLWLLSSKRSIKKYGFIAGILLTVISIFPYLWTKGKRGIEKDSNRGIITIPMTQFRSAPDGAGDFEIYEGTELEIMDQIGEWYKVRLLNSDVGWVKEGEYKKI